MRTAISPDNPLGHTRGGFAWEHVPAGVEAHLDFGCFEGRFLHALSSKNIRRRVGVDVNRDSLEVARRRDPGLELIHLTDGYVLPFADASFDSASILDVIEHIPDDRQARVFDELNRVLKPEGILIVTVPGAYLFSCLDLGNLKFRFPTLHKWFYCVRHSKAEYDRRYVANPDGLVGDISAEKAWHEHFTRNKLAALLAPSGFEVVMFDGAGFLSRPINLLSLPIRGISLFRRPITALREWDQRTFESMNLFCLARKSGRREGPADAKPDSQHGGAA